MRVNFEMSTTSYSYYYYYFALGLLIYHKRTGTVKLNVDCILNSISKTDINK